MGAGKRRKVVRNRSTLITGVEPSRDECDGKRAGDSVLVRTKKVVEEVVMLMVVEVPMEMVVEGGGSGSESGNGYHYGSCMNSSN